MSKIDCIMYEVHPGADIEYILYRLEEDTPVCWVLPRMTPEGDIRHLRPTEFSKIKPSYLCMDLSNNRLFQRDSVDPNNDLNVVTRFKYLELSLFIQDINNYMSQTTPKPAKEDSHWNCVCVCGADAYEDGFKYECKNRCGSLGPKDRRS